MKRSNDSLAIRFWTILAGFICVLGFAQMVLAQGAVDADSPLQQLRNTTISCGVSSAVLFLRANGCEKSIESLLSDAPTCKELSIADVAEFISKNGVSVVAVHMKANDFYHSCDTSAIAHLHPNGRSGHFSLMIPQQGIWRIYDPGLSKPFGVDQENFSKLPLTGYWIVTKGAFDSMCAKNRSLAFERFLEWLCILVGIAFLFFGLCWRKVRCTSSCPSSTVLLACVIFSCTTPGCSRERAIDGFDPESSTASEDLINSHLRIDDVHCPEEVRLGGSANVEVRMRNISPHAISAVCFHMGPACCTTYLLQDLTPSVVQSGEPFLARYTIFGRAEGFKDILEVTTTIQGQTDSISIPISTRVVKPKFQALAPVELDFGNLAIDSLEVPPVRGRTTLRTPPQDSITLEDFSVTALGEFKKLSVEQVVEINVDANQKQWEVAIVGVLNPSNLRIGRFLSEATMEIRSSPLKVVGRGIVRPPWSLNGTVNPVVAVRGNVLIPSKFVLDPFPSRPFSINSIDLTDAPSGLRASISEDKNILFSFDLAKESTDSSITSNCVINAILNVECDGRLETLSFPIDFVR